MLKTSTTKLTLCFSRIMLIIFMFFLIFTWETAAQKTNIAAETEDKSFPGVIAYEGYITLSDGTPLPDGQYDFTFDIYTTPSGGSSVWTEEHKSVFVSNGFIQLYLGKGTVPNPLNLPFDKQYYIGIRVGDTPEMTPRLELTSTGYSFRSKIADEVSNGSITSEKLAPRSVTNEKIESVSWNKLTDVPKNIQTGSPNEDLSTEPGSGNNGSMDHHDKTKYITGKGSITMVIDRDDDSDDKIFSVRRDGPCEDDDDDGDDDCDDEGGNEGVELFRIQENDSAWVDLIFNVADTTESTSEFNGALVVDGGVGIAKNLNIGGTFKSGTGSFKQLEVIGPGYYGPGNKHVALFYNNDANDGDGIAIKVNGAEPYSENNFITFLNQSDGIVGRVEGQTLDELHQSGLWKWEHTLHIVEIAGYTAEAIACGIQQDWFEVVVNGVQAVVVGIEYGRWWIERNNNVGIEFSSGSGDYAEYLERLNEEEKIEAGDIVGVFGGKITKSTTDAQQLMITSLAPIILGNMPQESEEHLYEKVAFMGQVLVKIIGSVKEGDYIIPSGFEDGTGIAVSPEMMTADEYVKVVGRAWSASNNESMKLINVVVGLTSTDIASIVKKQMKENQLLIFQLQSNLSVIQNTRSELEELKKEVANLNELNIKVIMLQQTLKNSDLQKLTRTENQVSETH